MIINKIKNTYTSHFRAEERDLLGMIGYKAMLSAASPVYCIKYHKRLEKTRRYLAEHASKVKHNKKSAFVFANGPSLSDIDLEKVAKLCASGTHELIAVNQFMTKSAHIVRPTFAFFSDNVHFSDSKTKYTTDLEVCRNLEIPYFVPAKFWDQSDPLQYAYCSLCNIDSKNTSNILRPAGYYGVTAFFAISLAKQIGYENIYLCGFDNNYFKDFEVNERGEMMIRHRHYYDKSAEDTLVPCLYASTSEFFFDSYRHFYYMEKIAKNCPYIKNIARNSYMSTLEKSHDLEVYL